MKVLFQWLDAHQGFYWGIAGISTLWLGLWTLREYRRPTGAGRHRHWGWIEAATIFAVVLAWRWPLLLETQVIGPDEAALVAAALTLDGNFESYHAVDALRPGILSVVALLPTHWLGIPQDYFNARLVALLMDCGVLVISLRLLSMLFRTGIALAITSPAILCLAVTSDIQWVQYSSGHAALLMAAGLALVFGHLVRSASDNPLRSTFYAAVAGGLAGLLPWADFRTGVIALGACLIGFVVLARLRGGSANGRNLTWGIGTALYVNIAVVAWLHGVGKLAQAWAGLQSLGTHLGILVRNAPPETFTGLSPGAKWSLAGAAFVMATAAFSAGIGRCRPTRSITFGALLVSGVGLMAWLLPGWFTYSFGLLPALWLLAALIAGEDLSRKMGWRGRRVPILGAVALWGGGHLAIVAWEGGPGMLGRLADCWRHPRSRLAQDVRTASEVGDTLGVWGDGARLHSESGLPEAGQSIDFSMAGDTSEWGATIRQRFLDDLGRKKPFLFVDTSPIDAGIITEPMRAHESFSALRDYVRNNYELIQLTAEGRLYVHRDQMRRTVLKRFGVSFLSLDGMTTKESLIEAREMDARRIFAHAPSRLKHPLPAGVRTVRGGIGFIEGAYANPGGGTSGAVFAIDLISRGGERQRVFERVLAPLKMPSDRGTVSFVVTWNDHDAEEIEFIVEEGADSAFDWTYWSDLRFDNRGGE